MSASRTTTAERGSRPCCCPPTARQRVARYWSFTRMLWRPFWSPLSASRRFAGGSVRNVRSASQSPYGVGAVWMPYCQKLAAAKRPAETIIHAAYTILRSFAWRLKRMAGTDATTTSSGPYEAFRNSSTDHGPTKLATRSGRTSAPSAHSARVPTTAGKHKRITRASFAAWVVFTARLPYLTGVRVLVPRWRDGLGEKSMGPPPTRRDPGRSQAASSRSDSERGTSTPSGNRAASTSSPFIASMNFRSVPT